MGEEDSGAEIERGAPQRSSRRRQVRQAHTSERKSEAGAKLRPGLAFKLQAGLGRYVQGMDSGRKPGDADDVHKRNERRSAHQKTQAGKC